MTDREREDKVDREVLEAEDELLRGLIEAGEDVEDQTVTIEIARRGKVYFRFRIRPLRHSEAERCWRKASTFVTNAFGVKVARETNRVAYTSLLIYEATVEEDRKRLWDNKRAWERFGVLSGPDLIDAVLLAGEKDAVVRKIEELSGFKMVDEAEIAAEEAEREELAKG